MSTSITIDPGSIRVRAARPSTGEIWLLLEGYVFPGLGWNDFVVVVMEAWIAALLRMLRGSSQLELVHFMEGPLAIELRRRDDNTLQLRALERQISKAQAEVPFNALLENAVSTAGLVLEACRERGDDSGDAVHLERTLMTLREEVAKATNWHNASIPT